MANSLLINGTYYDYTNGGDFAGTGAFSIVTICKPQVLGTYQYIVGFDFSESGFSIIDWAGDQKLGFWNSPTERGYAGDLLGYDEWFLLAVTKASGTVTPRFHRYRYSDANWVHADADGTLANLPTITQVMRLFDLVGEPYKGNMLITGLWDSQLSDVAIKNLAFSKQAWLNATPDVAFRFDTVAIPLTPFVGSATWVQRIGNVATLDTGDAPSVWSDGPIYTQTWHTALGGTDFFNAARVTDPIYQDSGALRLQSTAAVAYWEQNAVGGAQSTFVARVFVRFGAFPPVDVRVIHTEGAIHDLAVSFDSATRKLGCAYDTAFTGGVGGPELSLNTWYEIVCRFDMSTTAITVDARVNGIDLPQAGDPTALSADTYTAYKLGPNDVSTTMTMYLDSLEVSHTLSDYQDDFPLTPIIDHFNRADENPIANGWDGPIYSTINEMRVVSNKLAGQAGNFTAGSWWLTPCGPDMESFVTVDAVPTANQNIIIYVRGQNVGTTSLDGYVATLYHDGVSTIFVNLSIETDGGDTMLAFKDVTASFAAGDKIGIRVIGDYITTWHYTSGNWVLLSSVRDTTYTGNGYLGVVVEGSASGSIRLDDFGGGTISTIGTSSRRGESRGRSAGRSGGSRMR